jgi:hypothetical protein
MLKSVVGCAEFIECPFPNVEENGAGHGRPLVPGQHDKPSIMRQDVLVDVLEEPKRLRRKPVFLSRLALQAIEYPYGSQILRYFHGDPALVSFPDRATYCAIDVRKQDVLVIDESESMAVVTGRGRCAGPQRLPATAFHVFPVPCLGVAHGFFNEAMERYGVRT